MKSAFSEVMASCLFDETLSHTVFHRISPMGNDLLRPASVFQENPGKIRVFIGENGL